MAALVIEIEFRTVTPPARKVISALRHVAGELIDVVLSEQWLQCSSAGQPRVVFEVQQ